jgi:hypothetical protein
LVVALALRRRPAITTFCIADCHTFARRYRKRLNKFHRLDCRFSVADLEVSLGRASSMRADEFFGDDAFMEVVKASVGLRIASRSPNACNGLVNSSCRHSMQGAGGGADLLIRRGLAGTREAPTSPRRAP